MKKLMTAIVLCVLVFWTGRIYSINRKPQMVTYYSIGDIIDCGDLELSFVESHLVSQGDMTRINGRKITPEELHWAIKTCRGIADLDIGQALVVSQGTVIIAEAFDGTDAMIERAGSICTRPMGLVKLAKNTQDFRYDVPAFGMHTLQEMHKSGIVWAALESNRTIILDKSEVLAEANRLKIRLLGFKKA